MSSERKQLLEKIDKLIHNKKEILLTKYPNVHEVDDGIIVRFFALWDNCTEDNEIKFKKIEAENPDESVVFWYFPKGSSFELKQRYYIGCMTCLNGKIEVEVDGKNIYLEGYQKKCINSEDVSAKIHENTYLITTSDKSAWSEITHVHTEQFK